MNYVIRCKGNDGYRYLSYFHAVPDEPPNSLYSSSILDALFYSDKKSAKETVNNINGWHTHKYGFAPINKLTILAVYDLWGIGLYAVFGYHIVMNPTDDEIITEIFEDAADKGEGEQDTIIILVEIFEGLDENGSSDTE